MSKQEEQWTDVPGFEGRYQASNLGRIRSIFKREPCVLNGFANPDGYLVVRLYSEHSNLDSSFHRIICRTFHGAPLPGQQAAHLDGSRTNNRPDNLVWVSVKENADHKLAHGTLLAGERHPRARLSCADVEAIRSSPDTARQAAAKFGVSRYTIADIRQGKRWATLERAA